MERDELLLAMKDRMPEKRYIHTIGVTETAITLAERFGNDPKKLKRQQFFMIHASMLIEIG